MSYALPLLESALGSIDDSEGCLEGVIEQVQDLHLQACQIAKPDPEKLAERLFWWELNTAFETFYGAVDTYADVLGEVGCAAYQRLAQEAWEQLPVLAAGEHGSFDSKRWRLAQIMEQLGR